MFTGSLVALITPFRDGRVDEPALRALVDWHIAEGTNGLIPCGTTGESPALSDEEWDQVVGSVIEQAAGWVPVIAGTGSNSTAHTIERTQRARELGADGALIVTPYYNKPSQEGLYRHYAAVAEAVDLPLIPYNVPGRTGVNMLPETVVRLAQLPSIVAVKEASGSPDQSSQILVEAPDLITVLSGDDSLTLPIMSVGGAGVISVLANIVPGAVARMVGEYQAGNVETARMIHLELFDLARMMFVETNPVPVKTAAAWMGLCTEEVRLPLAPMADANRERLLAELQRSSYTSRFAAAGTQASTRGSAPHVATVGSTAAAEVVR